MPDPSILDLRPKPDASVADIQAFLATIDERAADANRRVAELQAQRKGVILSATAAELRAIDDQIATVNIEIEQLAALRDAAAGALPEAQKVADLAAQRARVDRANKLADELESHLARYPEHAAAIAALCKVSEHLAAVQRDAGHHAVGIQFKYPDVGMILPKSQLSHYHDVIRLPSVRKPGDDGMAEAVGRFWPPAYVPVERPPTPPRVYGPSTGISYAVRQPGTPPVARWGEIPDWGAPDAT